MEELRNIAGTVIFVLPLTGGAKKACAFGILQRRTLYFISMIVIKIAGGHLRGVSARVNNTERATHDELFVGFPAMPVVCM